MRRVGDLSRTGIYSISFVWIIIQWSKVFLSRLRVYQRNVLQFRFEKYIFWAKKIIGFSSRYWVCIEKRSFVILSLTLYWTYLSIFTIIFLQGGGKGEWIAGESRYDEQPGLLWTYISPILLARNEMCKKEILIPLAIRKILIFFSWYIEHFKLCKTSKSRHLHTKPMYLRHVLLAVK